jgi:hypothetical protein
MSSTVNLCAQLYRLFAGLGSVSCHSSPAASQLQAQLLTAVSPIEELHISRSAGTAVDRATRERPRRASGQASGRADPRDIGHADGGETTALAPSGW